MLPHALTRSALFALCLTASVTDGCSNRRGGDQAEIAFDEASCDTSFEARASRIGSQGQARLSYTCAADLCSAQAPFAAGTTQVVTIDVPSDLANDLQITSSDDAVIRSTNMRAVLDPCLGRTRAYLTLDARASGVAKLHVQADGIDDELSVQVLAAASISLRASPIRQFDFSAQSLAEALTGEPLLVLPGLVSAEGEPLLGLSTLTWSVTDEDLAAVRTKPNSEDESFVRDWADASAVFLDAKKPGVTNVRARTAEGAEGSLQVRITSR